MDEERKRRQVPAGQGVEPARGTGLGGAAGDAVETPHTVLPGTWITPLAGPANRQARVAAESWSGRL